MESISRRGFIGGAAAGLAVTAGIGTATASERNDDLHASDDVFAEPVMVKIGDVRTGEITVYAGTDEITYADHALARQLVRLAKR